MNHPELKARVSCADCLCCPGAHPKMDRITRVTDRGRKLEGGEKGKTKKTNQPFESCRGRGAGPADSEKRSKSPRIQFNRPEDQIYLY